jgi:lysophospholipase L1-like esterase
MRMLRLLGVLVAAGVLVVGAGSAGSASATPDGSANAMGYYLALGDSLAAGYQPGQGDDKAGGYTGPVLDAIQASTPKTRLVNLACSGETTTTMVSGGRCAYDEGSQLDQALEFLHAHGKYTRVVTVQIGANDVQRCVSRSPLSVDVPCVQAGLTAVATNLPLVLGKIHALAPEAQVIVLNYYNPFLVAYLLGDRDLGALSTALQQQLNAVIAGAAGGTDAAVADVAAAFHSLEPATNVTYICTYTWMCALGDIHANDAGYALIAQTVVARLG